MSNNLTTTFAGNLANDPELRHTDSGVAVTNFRVASSPRRYDKDAEEWVDGDPVFLPCTVWRGLADNVVQSLSKGDRVIVTGTLSQRKYEDKDGVERMITELQVSDVAASLLFRTCQLAEVDVKPPTRKTSARRK